MIPFVKDFKWISSVADFNRIPFVGLDNCGSGDFKKVAKVLEDEEGDTGAVASSSFLCASYWGRKVPRARKIALVVRSSFKRNTVLCSKSLTAFLIIRRLSMGFMFSMLALLGADFLC